MEQVRQANLAATESELGWTIKTDLDSGLQATYLWYRDLAAPDCQ